MVTMSALTVPPGDDIPCDNGQGFVPQYSLMGNGLILTIVLSPPIATMVIPGLGTRFVG